MRRYKTIENGNVENGEFVMIIYASSNPSVLKEVKALSYFLRAQGIHVVFDEACGLPGGESLRRFELKIIDENCKKVFVVIDDEYVKRYKSIGTGVYDEYQIIEDHFYDKKNYFIPVLCDLHLEIPVLFKNYIYLNIHNFDEIHNECMRDKVVIISSHDAKKSYERALEFYDVGDYEACSRILCTLMYSEIFDVELEIKILNLYMCCFIINHSDWNEHILHCFERMKVIISDNMCTFPSAYLNCSIIISSSLNQPDESIKYAESALEIAKNRKCKDLFDYECNLANLYLKVSAHRFAYDMSSKAREHYLSQEIVKLDTPSWIRICVAHCTSIIRVYQSLLSTKVSEAETYLEDNKIGLNDLFNLKNCDNWTDYERSELQRAIDLVNSVIT